MSRKLVPGDRVTFLASGLTIPPLTNAAPGSMGAGYTTFANQTIVITADFIENTLDRAGASWLDLVDDEAAQTARWGKPMFRRGDPEEGAEVGFDDEIVRYRRWQVANQKAHDISHPVERREALAKVREEFADVIAANPGV